MPKFLRKTIKATIISIIVALLITCAIILCINLFAGAQIDDAITLVSRVSIEINSDAKEKTNTTINKETKKIQNYPSFGEEYATIEIPKIDSSLPVYFGDTLEILKDGVGHSSGSYFPGEGGSVIYMGHNSENVYRRLGEVQIGDEITIKANYGEYKYIVYDMQLINETEGEKLPIQKDKEILMLYTCYPFDNIGHATQRYVLFAELEA